MLAHYYEGIPGFFDFQDIYTAAVDRAEDGAVLVEVGSWLGRSLAYLGTEIVNSGKDIELYSVDFSHVHHFPLDAPDVLGQLKWARELGYDGMLGAAALTRALQPCLDVSLVWQHYECTSTTGARLFQDGSCDFVFLDADHTLEGMRGELRAWWPKVKRGGMLAGHDWTTDFPGVGQAIQEFFPLDNSGLYTNIQASRSSWMVTKK